MNCSKLKIKIFYINNFLLLSIAIRLLSVASKPFLIRFGCSLHQSSYSFIVVNILNFFLCYLLLYVATYLLYRLLLLNCGYRFINEKVIKSKGL